MEKLGFKPCLSPVLVAIAFSGEIPIQLLSDF